MKCEKCYIGPLNAYLLDNRQLKLVFVPELGGRLMGLEYAGIEVLYRPENIVALNLDLSGDIEDITELRKTLGWRNLGGDKTWIGPQDNWDGPPYLDLDSGKYNFDEKETDEGVWIGEMTSPVCRETGIEIKRRFMVEPYQPELVLEQSISNRGEDNVTWSIWDVTQLNGPGEVYLPINPGIPCQSGLKIYKDFPADELLSDPSILNVDPSVAKVNCNEKKVFKVGSLPEEGWVEGVVKRNGKAIFYRKEFKTFPEQPYAHGCAIEVFNLDKPPYFEMEVQSPLYNLNPGQTESFIQKWTLGLR